MVNVVYQRVNEVLSNKQVSVNALSKLAGMAQTTLNTQLRGERALSVLIVVKILEIFPDISAEWLLRGEGEMYKSNSGSVQVEATITPPQNESPVSDYEPGYNLFITKDDKDKFYYVYLSYGPYNYANEEF